MSYPCAVVGCLAVTVGHYCDRHREACESCAHEVERGTLLRDVCDACADRELVEAARCEAAR
jgi:hypothetical protein